MSRKATPPSFIEIKVVEDGKAIDKIQIHRSKLKALNLKAVANLDWKDRSSPLFMATGKDAEEFFRKIL